MALETDRSEAIASGPMLDRLDRLGFMDRSADPTDRRRSVISITPGGLARCRELMEPLVREGDELLRRRFTSDELAVVTRFLTETTELQRAHVARLKAVAAPD
ncbi:winged helix DNA-binding protein [Mumia sp. zg.B17]|nr:winged helix DNA-binding protein [Mumia sp. zg.B17]